MRNLWVASLIVSSLTACAVPKSRNEMLGAFPPHTTVCSQQYSPGEAALRLQRAWSTCFVRPAGIGIAQTGGVPVLYEQSRIKLDRSKEDSTEVLTARIAEHVGMPSPLSNAILLLADFQPTSQCRTEIVVRAASTLWEKRAAQTEFWLKDPSIMPGEASCK